MWIWYVVCRSLGRAWQLVELVCPTFKNVGLTPWPWERGRYTVAIWGEGRDSQNGDGRDKPDAFTGINKPAAPLPGRDDWGTIGRAFVTAPLITRCVPCPHVATPPFYVATTRWCPQFHKQGCIT